jgi:hypothetical protein
VTPSRTPAAPVLWVPADAVRLAGVVSLATAAVFFDVVAVALLLLVLGGLMVPRVLGTTTRLDVAYGVGILVAAWSGVLDVYRHVLWWDVVVHGVVTGLVAVLGYGVVVRLGVARDAAEADRHGRRARLVGIPVLTAALGLGLSVVWELGEWAGHTYVDPSIHVSQTDTLGDLAAGGLGSLLAGVALGFSGRSPDDP